MSEGSDPWMEEGGPAFPIRDLDRTYKGMTLRDYFAAKAMQGVLASGDVLQAVRAGVVPLAAISDCAKVAFSLADAMLKAREQ